MHDLIIRVTGIQIDYRAPYSFMPQPLKTEEWVMVYDLSVEMTYCSATMYYAISEWLRQIQDDLDLQMTVMVSSIYTRSIDCLGPVGETDDE